MRTTKQGFLLAGVTMVFCIVVFMLHAMVPVIEQMLVDVGFAFVQAETPDSVVIVGMDAKSVSDVGAWPWPRTTFAGLIERINRCSPRAIALDFIFPKRIDDPDSDSLAAVFSRTPNLVVGMRLESVTDNADATMSMITTEAYKHRFLMFKNQDGLGAQFPYSAGKVDLGDPFLTTHAKRSGFLNVSTRRASQKLRELIHVIRAGKEFYPSFGIAATAAFLQLPPDQLVLDGNGFIRLGAITVPLRKGSGSLDLRFRGPAGTIRTISASDVLSGAVDPALLRNKLVFVGITDAPSSPSDFFITPVGTQFPGVEIWATAASDIVTRSWISPNIFLAILNIVVMLFIFPGCVLVFPGARRRFAIIVGTITVAASIVIGFILLSGSGLIWNAGFHCYAWVFLIVWSVVRKSDQIIIEKRTINLDPKQSDEQNAMRPPEENNFISAIPSNDTAAFIMTKLATVPGPVAVVPAVDKTMVEGDVPLGAPVKPLVDDTVVREFQKLAGGRIVKCIGSGGMADVYLIWHPRMEVYRAIKVIKPGQPAQWLDRFETEIRIFANLNHPNIVQCYGVGEWHTLPYLEMEYVFGASMEDILKTCTMLSPAETIAIGILVCRALGYAHHQVITVYGETYKGIVHRDLKPANILLGRTGQIKLTDFGIARPGAVSLHTADSGKVVGTLPYLAPEQLNEEPLTEKTDIYALGATLYELLSGTRPFPQLDIPVLIAAKANGTYKPLKVSSSTPKDLVDIIACAMATDPDKRFHTANDMGNKLEQALNAIIIDRDTFMLDSLVKRAFQPQ